MKCKNCGTEFEGKFCTECGTPANETANPENNTTEQPGTQAQSNFGAGNIPAQPKKKKKPFYKKWWFIALVVVAALIVIINVFGGKSSVKKNAEEFVWNSFTLHEKLPEPKSNMATSVYDNSDSLSVSVANTSKDDYKEYVGKCESEYGYTIDKSKSNTSFSASNEEGYDLSIIYFDSDEEMSIHLREHVEKAETAASETTASETTAAVEETTASETTAAKSESSGGMRTEFKEAMDSYEAFMDEYIAFMEKYAQSSGTDLSIITDYATYMSKYAEMCKQFDEWEGKDLNAAETAYYIEVQTRVSQKLLTVANQ